MISKAKNSRFLTASKDMRKFTQINRVFPKRR